MKYAEKTSVSVSRSTEEIRALVMKHGAKQFGLMEVEKRAVVSFALHDRNVMFEVVLPDRALFKFKKRQNWRGPEERSATEQEKLFAQACRAQWRALLLTIKSKLVSVDAGVETFEEAFLAHVIVPGTEGHVRFSKLATQYIAAAYSGGPSMPLLGSGSAESKH